MIGKEMTNPFLNQDGPGLMAKDGSEPDTQMFQMPNPDSKSPTDDQSLQGRSLPLHQLSMGSPQPSSQGYSPEKELKQPKLIQLTVNPRAK